MEGAEGRVRELEMECQRQGVRCEGGGFRVRVAVDAWLWRDNGWVEVAVRVGV